MYRCRDMYDLYSKAIRAMLDYKPDPEQNEELIIPDPVDPPVPEGPELDLDEIYENEKE